MSSTPSVTPDFEIARRSISHMPENNQIEILGFFEEILPRPYLFMMAAQGALNNVMFKESDLIKRMQPVAPIMRIVSSHGEVNAPGFSAPSAKRNFDTQISFWVDYEGELYKCKIFQNGKIKVPGGRASSMEVFKVVVNIICVFLSTTLNKVVDMKFLEIITSNYKSSVQYHININRMYNILRLNKVSYPDCSHIVSTVYDYEKCTTLSIEFDYDKNCKVKFFNSGKLNFVNVKQEYIDEVYGWVRQLFYMNDLLYNVLPYSDEE